MIEWIGPAVVATAVSAAVTVIGWYVSHQREGSAELRRRQERVSDVQTALRAEIRSYRARAAAVDLDAHGAEMERRIRAGDFTPFVPKEPEFFIYASIAKEIHILPGSVIDPIVLFYTQGSTVALFAEDLRTERFQALEAGRKVDMYLDYLAMTGHGYRLADQALQALDASLGAGHDQ